MEDNEMSKQDYILILRAMATEFHELELKAKTEEERYTYWAKRKYCTLEYERVCGIIPDFDISYPVGFVLAVLEMGDRLFH